MLRLWVGGQSPSDGPAPALRPMGELVVLPWAFPNRPPDALLLLYTLANTPRPASYAPGVRALGVAHFCHRCAQGRWLVRRGRSVRRRGGGGGHGQGVDLRPAGPAPSAVALSARALSSIRVSSETCRASLAISDLSAVGVSLRPST